MNSQMPQQVGGMAARAMGLGAPMGGGMGGMSGGMGGGGMGGMKRGGVVKKMASGGMTSKTTSASKRGDGIAQRGKTKGRMC
jgi:hypothetical protein